MVGLMVYCHFEAGMRLVYCNGNKYGVPRFEHVVECREVGQETIEYDVFRKG